MSDRQDFLEPYSEADVEFARSVVQILAPILDSLARSFPTQTEVLLQDITQMPRSIAAIAQPLTGRSVGGPPTNVILDALRTGDTADHLGYRAETKSGSALRSSAIYFRGPSGRPVVCLCVNSLIDDLLQLESIVSKLTATTPIHRAERPVAVDEAFPGSVEVLSDSILAEEIERSDIEVDLMKKPHKMQIVSNLDKRGFFLLRGSVELAARELKVSRHTIYNYLNELPNSSSGD